MIQYSNLSVFDTFSFRSKAFYTLFVNVVNRFTVLNDKSWLHNWFHLSLRVSAEGTDDLKRRKNELAGKLPWILISYWVIVQWTIEQLEFPKILACSLSVLLFWWLFLWLKSLGTINIVKQYSRNLIRDRSRPGYWYYRIDWLALFWLSSPITKCSHYRVIYLM